MRADLEQYLWDRIPSEGAMASGHRFTRDVIREMVTAGMIESPKQAWRTLEKWLRKGKYTYGGCLDLGWKVEPQLPYYPYRGAHYEALRQLAAIMPSDQVAVSKEEKDGAFRLWPAYQKTESEKQKLIEDVENAGENKQLARYALGAHLHNPDWFLQIGGRTGYRTTAVVAKIIRDVLIYGNAKIQIKGKPNADH